MSDQSPAGVAADSSTGMDDARHGAAALLGASADTIAIATSFTEALNQVAWWLRPGRGQNIVPSEADVQEGDRQRARRAAAGIQRRAMAASARCRG